VSICLKWGLQVNFKYSLSFVLTSGTDLDTDTELGLLAPERCTVCNGVSETAGVKDSNGAAGVADKSFDIPVVAALDLDICS
jgi:hypothetical protein